MILGDKICNLRKKNGWSQEELAEKMNVSRQAVSKWESAQSVPDLEKILQLSALFGVSTDFLLKDEIEMDAGAAPEPATDPVNAAEDGVPLRQVSMEEANAYLALRETCASRIALATLLCILSPICLIFLCGLAEYTGLSENLAAAVGLVVLLGLVAVAVTIFVSCGLRSEPYEYLENEPFETAYGVSGMVRERQAAFRDLYGRANVLGAFLCVASPIPLLVGAFLENGLLVLGMVCVLLLLVGCGVWAFVWAGVRQSALQRLLQEGEYSRSRKRNGRLKETVSGIFWLLVVAIYLAWSFLSGDWHLTWLVWPIAAVLSAVLDLLCDLWKK